MANIILPASPIVETIDNDANFIIEQAGEINRYPISDLSGGDITIDLISSDSDDKDIHSINADTLSGYIANDFIKKMDMPLIPSVSNADNGKFLKVINGVPAWEYIVHAEEVAF